MLWEFEKKMKNNSEHKESTILEEINKKLDAMIILNCVEDLSGKDRLNILKHSVGIKPTASLTIIFFIVLSLANMAAISINSNNWKTMDDSEVGLWINENIDGIILIDSKYCNEYDFRNIDTLCSKKNKSSLIGFWINDEIKIGNPNEVPANYIITRDILSLEKIYELDGTFIYKSA